MHHLAQFDHQHAWHPFTQMRDWLKTEPIVIVEGHGASLRDVRGRTYLDANSSIWTNLHGHKHPKINAGIQRQLGKIAHSSALGLANEPASLLAQKLVRAAKCQPGGRGSNPELPLRSSGAVRKRSKDLRSGQPAELVKVFFSDDGSTAVEVALKMAYEYTRRLGRTSKPRFLSLAGAYHGDTVGAVSLGHIPLFHQAYSGLLFKTDRAMSPYCYRCPFNRAKPDRADARHYRKCQWECIEKLESRFRAQKKRGNPYAAFVFEPLMQGAAGMIPQPAGWLRLATETARAHGALLIADEVMTGFGRTGTGQLVEPNSSSASQAGSSGRRRQSYRSSSAPDPGLFACQHEDVRPDFLALAKGLTGGYVPMAATLTTQAVFDAFLGDYAEFKTFFHGHSFTANQIGAAAALASLEILSSPGSLRARNNLERALHDELKRLWDYPEVGDIRQVGLIAAVELVKTWRTREPFDVRDRVGIRVCELMAKRGVLTRPVGNVIVLMPPYCTTREQVHTMVTALGESVSELFS